MASLDQCQQDEGSALSKTNQFPNLTFSVADTKQEARCLGYWWKYNLGEAEAIIEKGEEGLIFCCWCHWWVLLVSAIGAP